MAIVINGDGTITGISVGGLPDGIVDAGTLATNSVDSAELVDGSIDTSHFSADCITADEIGDDIVNKILKTVITNPAHKNKIIFDGYPRNINQAENLELMLNGDNQSINFILFLKVNREIAEKRILGRIICEKCNKTFNEYLNKKEIEKHECGNSYLKKRKDDNQEVIITRYDEYMRKTKPVLDFYSSRNYFHEIDGSQEIQVITNKIKQILRV